MNLVCEIMFDRHSHVPFNAGFLATIQAAFPREDLAFYGAAAHIEQLKNHVGQAPAQAILWKKIVPIPPSGPGYGERFIRELKVFRLLLRELHRGSNSRLILTSAFPSTVLAMKVARFFESTDLPVQMVLHEMSGVIGRRYRRPILRFQDMKTAVTIFGNKGIQYLLLEEFIRDLAVKSLPNLAERIKTFEHPISPSEGAIEVVNLTEPLRFGFLGAALKSKGYASFVATANAVTSQYGRRAEFHVIGRRHEESHGVHGVHALTTQPADAPLTRDDFIRGVAPLHYIVLPYEAAAYTLSASGVFLDAMAWQKPIIARKIPMFEAMFDKYGDLGYLFSDDSELRDIVAQILHTPDAVRYRCQALRLGEVRKLRAPEALAAAYRQLCEIRERK